MQGYNLGPMQTVMDPVDAMKIVSNTTLAGVKMAIVLQVAAWPEEPFGYRELALRTNRSEGGIYKAVQQLLDARVLLRASGAGSSGDAYILNPDVDRWDVEWAWRRRDTDARADRSAFDQMMALLHVKPSTRRSNRFLPRSRSAAQPEFVPRSYGRGTNERRSGLRRAHRSAAQPEDRAALQERGTNRPDALGGSSLRGPVADGAFDEPPTTQEEEEEVGLHLDQRVIDALGRLGVKAISGRGLVKAVACLGDVDPELVVEVLAHATPFHRSGLQFFSWLDFLGQLVQAGLEDRQSVSDGMPLTPSVPAPARATAFCDDCGTETYRDPEGRCLIAHDPPGEIDPDELAAANLAPPAELAERIRSELGAKRETGPVTVPTGGHL